MEVIIRPTHQAAIRLAARVIADQIRRDPSTVLGLATGRTMESLYAELVRVHTEEGLDFSLCRTFNLDEYVGLHPDHPGSYRRYMNTHLFDRINIDTRNTHLPHGLATDLEAECQRYEKVIEECDGVDLQLLGIGESGHIGFNEPLSALQSRTRDKCLSPVTIAQNAPLFDPPESMPQRGITMGVGTILESRRCLLLCTGEGKASIIAKAVEGPITSMISASALQLHRNCQIVVDAGAARDLCETAYYRRIFETEPRWKDYQDIH